MTTREKTFVERCREFLTIRWQHVTTAIESRKFADPLLPDHGAMRVRVVACLTSPTKSYHYVLPTQLLCNIDRAE